MTDTRNDLAPTDAAPQGRSMMQWAVVAFLISVVLTAVGTFLDLTGNDDSSEEDELVIYLVLLTVLAVITYAVYRTWFTPAAAAPVAPNSTLVAGILAAAMVVVFWTGLPAIFAVGALVLGRKGGGVKAVVGTVLAALALLVCVWAAIAG